MEHNSEEIFPPTMLLPPIAEQQYLPHADLINGHDNGIQRFQGHNMLQIESTGHNTEQGSGSGLPLRMGGIRFGEQGSGLPQPNMVGTDVTAAVTGWPGQKRTDPWHGNRIQRSLVHEIMPIEPTGHNTEQGSGSGSGLPWSIRISELGSGSGSDSGQLWRNEAPVGDIRIGEQGSGSGLPRANMVETEATAAVPGRPGQNRNGESNSAKRSQISRDKKKKEEHDMKEKMQWLEEKYKRLQKENKKLKKNQNKSNRKQNVQLRKIHRFNERLARSKKACDELQIQTNSLSQTVVNMSSLQEENRRLQADKDLLMQQVNAGSNAKKWVKISLEDRKLKIDGNVLFLKMA